MKDNIKLVVRLINFMKRLLPIILLAVFFAVFGFLITVYIPAKIISLGFGVLNGEDCFWLYLQFQEDFLDMGSIISDILLHLKFWRILEEKFFLNLDDLLLQNLIHKIVENC